MERHQPLHDARAAAVRARRRIVARKIFDPRKARAAGPSSERGSRQVGHSTAEEGVSRRSPQNRAA